MRWSSDRAVHLTLSSVAIWTELRKGVRGEIGGASDRLITVCDIDILCLNLASLCDKDLCDGHAFGQDQVSRVLMARQKSLVQS